MHRARHAWPPGALLAVIAFALDRVHKWWMLDVYDIGVLGRVEVTPFLDLVLVWNRGISYGLLQQDTPAGRAILLIIMLGVAGALAVWMARTRDRFTALALGLVIGGALGNALDRYLYGAVADFFSLHAFGFYWYVFNLADVAIVAGVLMLLYDSFFGRRGGQQ